MLRRNILLSLLLACTASAAAAQEGAPAPVASHYAPRPAASSAASGPLEPIERSPFPVRLAAAETAAPAGPGSTSEPLRLAPRSAVSPLEATAAASDPRQMLGTVAGSLGLVVGVFLVLAWVSRKLTPASSQPLPREVVELLGRAPLAGRQQMQLVRIGNRLVLIATSPNDCRTLTEIRDPAEVEHLTALCRRGRPGSSTASFNQVMQQLSSEPSHGRQSTARAGLRGAS